MTDTGNRLSEVRNLLVMSNEYERAALESQKAAGRILAAARIDRTPENFTGEIREIGLDTATVDMLVYLAAGGKVRT